jgi:hypothetical protein
VTEAARPFFGVAAREPATWRNPLFFAGIAFVAGVAWISDETSSVAVEVGTGVVAAVVVLVLTLRAAIRQRAMEYGKEAFLRAYGGAHRLVAEQPRAFHARQVNANLPGAAEFVLSGQLPRLNVPGSLLLCNDQARFSKTAEYVALVAPGGDENAPTVRTTSDGLGYAREGGAVSVWAERSRSDPLSAAELDAFLERAARVIAA